uniref:Uncharacterized protein n=1 Tax=Romanomermis culicivorax TaxID=13658 RepID=A0A915IVR3_ROMCU
MLFSTDFNRTVSIPEWYSSLFVIQILNLIAAFALLCASISLIFGVHTNTRFLICPWFPSSGSSILCSFINCILWWVGIYCMICIYIHYGRIGTESGINGRTLRKGKNMKVHEYKTKTSPIVNGDLWTTLKLAYDNRVFEDETSSPQTKVNLCQIAESQKSILLTKTDRAEDEIFLTNHDNHQQKQQRISLKEEQIDAKDEQPLENNPTLEGSFKDKFLKEVVASSEQIPVEIQLPQIVHDSYSPENKPKSNRGRNQQKDSLSRSSKFKESESRHRCHKRRSSHSRVHASAAEDNGRGHHHPRRRRSDHDESSDDDNDSHCHRVRRRPLERRSRSRSSCGHYERKKSRERSVSRGTQAATTSDISGGGGPTLAAAAPILSSTI